MRIAVIFGTRPEAIKLAPVIRSLKENRDNIVTVLCTGQHKQMLDPILEWFEIAPDRNFQSMRENQSLASLTAKNLELLNLEFESNPQDLILVQGDTTTAFVAALAAFYNKIKVGHVEAGLRTFEKLSPWPEEGNRNLISKLADYHFAPTWLNHENLAKENIPISSIHVTGNTVIDALIYSMNKVREQRIYPESLSHYFTPSGLEKRVVLITGHRRENIGEGFVSICHSIRSLAIDNKDVHFIYPVHFNPNVRTTVMGLLGGLNNIRLIEPLGYPEFISLMMRSYLILTDSGGIQEEGPSLGKPVLVMRENTERPEALSRGTVILVGTNREKIYGEVTSLLTDRKRYEAMSEISNPYGDGKSAEKIVEIIGAKEVTKIGEK